MASGYRLLQSPVCGKSNNSRFVISCRQRVSLAYAGTRCNLQKIPTTTSHVSQEIPI
ncbi:hypothetical protein BABINDRAFT_161133 [Babjeviella inositovora NRRL Y-12698]|uniref:Uncharacterized protein n=1 Tax=Babjeviella inositovora NRRL Y-12698 TaxID=984486 RepID=A0A1E3QT06_9ASCO|nr:uncharacterized protein BABINDRAFT_161133 [Babjeviella inositovora NRRL Y-12698]ODQ80152.1 hypothetical protein BABINDRAFT_161133 [Babjeviella inositovora NRRL Y-12698]